MAYLKWQKNFQCGNTAIGLFCSVFLLKQQIQNNRILSWGTIKKVRENEWNAWSWQAVYLKPNLNLCVNALRHNFWNCFNDYKYFLNSWHALAIGIWGKVLFITFFVSKN